MADDHQIWLANRARELRRDQTPNEQQLWRELRARRFAGYKFRRQVPLGGYVVDFVCFKAKLVVELDGSQHAAESGHDATRDAWLAEQGYRVLRFWNNEWSGQREGVLTAIWAALQEGTDVT